MSGVNTASAASGTYTSESYNGRKYGKYVPSGYDGSTAVPLVMMLHGCSQSADGFKDETQMNQVAEEHNFIAIYPNEDEGIYSCWNWFEDSNTLRGQGQVKELAEGIVGQVKANENVDADRIYVAGFSAGAYMAPNLLVEYPDVFAACGIHSGGMYDVAETQSEGNQVISDSSCDTGSSADPQQEAQHAYDRMVNAGLDDYNVPTIVFHGTDDSTVYPCHGEEAAEQFTELNDLLDDDSGNGSVDYTADATNSGSGSSLSYTEYEYDNADGVPVVEHYVVDGMSHAWSGGSSGGSYTAPGGPEASQIMWEFFSNWDNSLNDQPSADVVASDTIADVGQTVDFDGSGSSDPDGSISKYEWDFTSDGTVDATGSTASHSYSSTGNYDVTLTVTDDGGATDTTTVTIQVCDGNCPPKADVVASSTSVTTEDTVDFDATGSADADSSISSYEWDFQTDGSVDATGSTASHTYSSTGTYTATVTVTDDDGATDSASVEITVESALYCGEAENETHVNEGRAYNSGGCYYAEGSDQYMGSCISTDLCTLEETSTGYFEVVDSCPDGGSDGGNSAPTADVSASSTTVNTGETVDFDATGSSDSDGSISSYEWDWTSDGTYDATGSTASHSWSSSGDYTVTLRVTDDAGATDTATVTITVESSNYCGTATNQTHVDNGRAYYSGGCYYAEGSNQYLGCMSATETTLKETSTGYYEEVSSC